MKIGLTVKPNSKKGPLVEETEGGLVVYVREPAVDGKANTAVVKLLSKYFDVPKTGIRILKGQSGRSKLVEIL